MRPGMAGRREPGDLRMIPPGSTIGPPDQGRTWMKLWIVLACLLVVPLGGIAREKLQVSNSIMTMRVDGEITIDQAGSVLDYKITTPIKPEMQQLLDKAVRKWTFHPVTVDGKPAIAKNNMRITLAAREAGSGYAVSVDNVTFRRMSSDSKAGQGKPTAENGAVIITAKSMKPGHYPTGLAQAGVEGAVLLDIRVSPQGNVEDVVAVQSSLYDVRGRPDVLEDARKLLEVSAIAAAKKWKFNVTVTKSNPTAADLTVSVPHWYVMEKNRRREHLGQWRVELRSEKAIVPWLLDARTAQDIGVSDLDSDDVMPLASALKAPVGVIGKTL
jgi:TonB family protein